MPVTYGSEPPRGLNAEMRHGFEEQYKSEQFLQTLAEEFYFYFDDKRHKTNGNPTPEEVKQRDADGYYQPITDWKITKDRQKTVSAALLLCLNLGVDPPDVTKTHPCARVEAWVDPLNFQDSKKAIEQIGKNLQSQYETLSLRTRYKQSLDPCVEDVKRFCNSLRRTSKNDQILFHYNGHGVPQPTPSGEIWVFNRGYTQYIPVSLYDLQTWLGAPCIFVWDCNSAGNIVTNFQKFIQKRIKDDEEGNHDTAAPSPTAAYTECFQLASCRSNELLLMVPELPADLFTCCLTCPIEISVRVFLMQSSLRHTKYKIFFENSISERHPDPKNSYRANAPNVHIPGMLSDRRTPLGELNWIFTAITDTIAWTCLPRPLFKKLFRHDLMIAALFRNFLLAKRIMPWYNCHPISDPELPDSIITHSLWKSWDFAMDEVLSKLVVDLKNAPPSSDLETQLVLQQQEVLQNQKSSSLTKMNGNDQQQAQQKPGSIRPQSKFSATNLSTMSLANHPALQKHTTSRKSSVHLQQQPQQQQQFTGFFEQNLTAFELWLKYMSNVRNPPEQLPIVLQVLLSQVHRIRALVLLSRFLDLGPWAVYLSLSIGIFPYVLKLLQSPAPELKPILVFIWARIMCIDYKNTQTELIKEKGYMYFVNVIVPDFGLLSSSAGSASSFNNNNPLTMATPTNTKFMRQDHPYTQQFNGQLYHSNDTTDEQKAMAVFVLSSFVRDFPLGQKYCFTIELVNKLCYYTSNSDIPLLRQWSIILLGLLYIDNPLHKWVVMNLGVFNQLLASLNDPVPEVRTATVMTLKHFISSADDTDNILRLQQDFEKQYQQLQVPLQQVLNSLHQRQNQQQQQHLEQQQVKLEQQLATCQIMQNQLENIDLKRLKGQEINILVAVLPLIDDGSSLVRKEVIIYFSQLVYRYSSFFLVVAFNELTEDMVQLEGLDADSVKMTETQSVSHGSIFSTVWKALLILSSDPYLENRHLAEKVVDYILLELSSHKDLCEPFTRLERYLYQKNSKLNSANRMGFSSNPVQAAKPKMTSFGNNSTKKNTREDDNASLKSGLSLGALFRNLGFNENRPTNFDNDSSKSKKNKTNTPISLLGTSHGTSFVPPTPRYKKITEPPKLPFQSTFLDYCREYFQEPQMRKPEADEVGSVEYNAKVWRRNRNENIINETQRQKKLSLCGDWSNKLVTFDNKTQPKLLRFTQFEDHVAVADDRDNITLFDWDENKMLSRFSNSNPFGTKITDLKFINEDDSTLLMTGSSDGIIKIFKDINSNSSVELIAAWRGLTEMLLTPRSNGLLTEWHQMRGALLATGDVKIIRIWDAHTETVEVDIPAKTSSLVTSLTSDQLAGNIFVAGFADGTLRVYDRRIDARDSMVRRWRSASTGRANCWINNVHMQRGGYRELVSGTSNGVVELWDIRHQDAVHSFVDENENSHQTGDHKQNTTTLTSLQVHEHAPIIATSSKQIKIWTTSGDLLTNFRNAQNSLGHNVANTLAATGITSYSSNSFISSMTFHPHRMMLAASNSHDSHVNIYKCVNPTLNQIY
ncbi:ubiquitin-binding TORC1 subunit KOG1 KNAG_0D02720 [Huiozyma naganishii CBS 8797]|uniref:Raptor N-terminal CASPase-like domain-containing protein n=1 Tax=Huiozyma naganishii (strain ATCC MYA-139 / BCRC 22969 / CBS 8797 / KCTC 17520 / NBRC 10181 / NCYC 3082 / Yp74L-3) TaxID=1071383 RepID=J7S701_HUIN7|nr:hypothetical protein KNAG_0D02720 [Kazachstania naganishii CBS 8797]CCK70021.1 hypothetical protein KNAG_0D02720 [Kazachstania naganishii CBS 8797]